MGARRQVIGPRRRIFRPQFRKTKPDGICLFDWEQSEGTHLKVSIDPNEQVRYMHLGSVSKPREVGRFPRATYSAGDQIVVRYSEPGCLTRTSPVTSSGSQVGKVRRPTVVDSEDMGIAPAESLAETQPARVQLKI